MKVYIVIDWSAEGNIEGVFKNENDAEKCKAEQFDPAYIIIEEHEIKGEIRMIKLSIKNQIEPEKEEEFEGVLHLEEGANGSVILKLNDKNGDDWYILKLKADGTLEKFSGLFSDIGLQIDEDGRISESEDD